MKLTLFSDSTFHSILLPQKCGGQYWVCMKDSAGNVSRIMAVDGNPAHDGSGSGEWILKSNSRYRILSPYMEPIARVSLEPLTLYMIQRISDGAEFRLFTEPLTEDRKQYKAYRVLGDPTVLEIGRNPNCAIRYNSEMVSKSHASLFISNNGMVVADNDSLNHTFVNGMAIQQANLKIGDVIFIMGMQIVVSGKFLFLNNPDGKVSVHSRLLEEYRKPAYTLPTEDTEEDDPVEEEDFYYRAPRFKHDVDPLELKIDPPPNGQGEDTTPMIMSIGPSMTMGMVSATTAVYSVINATSSGSFRSAIPSLVMSAGMLCGTLVWPTIMKFYQRKTNRKKEELRRSTYTEYLRQTESKIQNEMSKQAGILRENDGTTAEYIRKVTSQPLQIWERTPKHTDFLRLRLGSGSLPLSANIQYPEQHFSVTRDDLQEAMYRLAEAERKLENVPICLPLTQRFVCGIYSDHRRLMDYAKSLILQITALHSYDEVKLVLLYNANDEEELSFARWLPHTMDNERRVRFIATNSEEAKTLSSDLEAIIDRRKQMNPEQLEEESPYYVVICLDKPLSSRTECLQTLKESKENLRFSYIAMYERLKDLPKECSAVIELTDNNQGSVTMLNDVSDPPVYFRADDSTGLDMQIISQVLSNTALDVSDSAFQLPKKYTFLQMLGIGMIEHINLVERWSASNPIKSLAAPIGIDPYGEHFFLDIHEKAHGPHGLIAGMTGSGKSETIIAYVLSMAINFHPHDVAFILIDYKGGGMAKAFADIPHTAGIITNLDGNAINRSLVSLKSELHRRELIFQQASKKYGVSNIDIYKYQKLYREGKVSEPLPHLVIISDEFAELKKDQPDFMAALTSTARVGRSLGVHLLLATQKPGGVVDDQIRSNSRFRLCLKVQDRADSTEMMGRPEASNLVDTGRFYLQVGNNELFKMGQSAWAGAPYHPSPKPIQEKDDSVSVINTNGRTIAEVNTDRHAGDKDARKQLDIITEYIRKAGEEEHIPQWKMWLDPIPAKIYVDDLAAKYPGGCAGPFELNPIAGEYDDPTHQRQNVLRVPLSSEGNAVVYGSTGSGKSSFLESMCYSLMKEHTPNQVNLYIMDFGSENLTAFSGAPHVGDVILSQESEKVENLFKLLHGKLNTRKKLLARFGGSLAQYNAQAQKPEPNIVVMINNFANFTELYEGCMGDINYLTREGTRYGIYFVLTCTGVNNVRFSLLQNFKCLYCLQLNNANDYATVVGKTEGIVLGKVKGRGMARMEKGSLYEFQTARVVAEDPPYAYFRTLCKELSAQYPDYRAQSVPVLPQTVSVDFLARHAVPGLLSRTPVGVEKETLEIAKLDLTARSVHMVLSLNQEWKPFTDDLADLLADHLEVETMLLDPTGGAESGQQGNLRVCADRNSCVAAIYDIFQQVLTRNNTYKEAIAAGENTPQFQPLVVVIQSLSQLKSLVDGYSAGKAQASDDTPINRLLVAMEKCAKEYKVTFLVAENLHSLTPHTAEKWYKAQVNANSGIWIGNGISSQYRLNVSSKPKEFNSNLEKSFGFLVENAGASLVKFLQ